MSVLNTKKKHNIWSVKQAEVSSSETHNKFNVTRNVKQAEVSSSETHNKFNVTRNDKTTIAITSSYNIT
jgi:1,2-phenylacetyl-CoA epoxidase PaaB subunit